MGGNHLDVTVILMSSCLFKIILEGLDTPHLTQERVLLYCKPVQTHKDRHCGF